ncbi:kinase A anchor protein [Lipomyces japonicus]|uniref:kinase A anchor protein n=1 Tax=Lipomyces japonicus TaxID=56871 RepID=UPI0034CEE47E
MTSKRLTHFLSIPLHHSRHIKDSLTDLQAEIATRHGYVPLSCLSQWQSMHITIAVMSLQDKRAIAAALAELHAMSQEESSSSIWPQQGFDIGLQGLNTFTNQSPRQAAVVFADVVGPDKERLQEFVNNVKRHFVARGLIADNDNNGDDGQSVKLHASIIRMGSVFENGRPRRKLIDARKLIKRYRNHTFLRPERLPEIQLCLMGKTETGYYRCEGTVPLP